ncbi:MAG: response regulator transcription factor [Lutisporaceae bacterium]
MKVLVVDDHPMVRKGLLSILSLEDNVDEIKEASDTVEVIKVLDKYNPDIIIVDLKLGKDNGLDLVSLVRQKNKAIKCIVLTSSSKKDDFFRAQELEVDAYILKDAFPEDILYAFHVVARGKKYFDPAMLENGKSQEKELDGLTPREVEVLTELGKGCSNLKIAESLYISENTVKKHISSILGKLGLEHRVEAVVYLNNYLI